MAQRYTDQVALRRMDKGLCPECGGQEDEHSGLGGPYGCILTDFGVWDRIRQFNLDMDRRIV